MKLKLKFLATFLLSFLILVPGCKSLPLETQCFNTVKAAAVTVDTGMNVAGDLYRAGTISEAQKTSLIALHDQKVMPVIEGAGFACKGIQDRAAFDKLIADVSGAAADITKAIAAFGKK